MEFIKSYGMAVLGLAIMLIVLNQLIKLSKKTPLKGIADKVEDLTGLE